MHATVIADRVANGDLVVMWAPGGEMFLAQELLYDMVSEIVQITNPHLRMDKHVLRAKKMRFAGEGASDFVEEVRDFASQNR